MRVKVLFFGMLKDITGSAEEQINVSDGAQLENIFEHYAGRFPRLREMASSIVLARNHEFSPVSARVSDGDEVAFLDYPAMGWPAGAVALVDRLGRKRTLASGFIRQKGLAWSPRGDEVWFTATRRGSACAKSSKS